MDKLQKLMELTLAEARRLGRGSLVEALQEQLKKPEVKEDIAPAKLRETIVSVISKHPKGIRDSTLMLHLYRHRPRTITGHKWIRLVAAGKAVLVKQNRILRIDKEWFCFE